MGSRTGRILVIVVAGVAGLASFAVTRLKAVSGDESQCGCAMWLSNPSQAVAVMEADFNASAGKLADALADEQATLLGLLEDSGCSDEAVLAQAEKVSEAHTALFKLAADHAIALRGQLPAEQCECMMQYCSGVVCGGGAGGGRGQGGGGMGMGRGRGMGGRGMGGGGMRGRRGRGFAWQLALTDEQIASIAAKDPDYEFEREALRQQMVEARGSLGAMLQDPGSSDEMLYEAVEAVIALHHQLDSRVARHVVVMRDELTVEQQKLLIGLCAGRCARTSESR